MNIGDKIFIKEDVHIEQFTGFRRNWVFNKTFFKAITVEKVLKTQFVAGGLRFMSDGYRYGNNKVHAYGIGDNSPSFHCQGAEAEAYRLKIAPLNEYRFMDFESSINPLNSANVDDALKAHELYQQLEAVINA